MKKEKREKKEKKEKRDKKDKKDKEKRRLPVKMFSFPPEGRPSLVLILLICLSRAIKSGLSELVKFVFVEVQSSFIT